MTRRHVIIASACSTERKLLGFLLTSDGFSVREADSAKQVVEHVRQTPAHLILLDTLFWETAALNTLLALKRDPAVQNVPVVLFGNLGSDDDINRALRSGASLCVGRDEFEIELFIDRLRTLIEEHVSGGAAGNRAAAKREAPRFNESNDTKLSKARLEQALQQVAQLGAFEHSITEAITTVSGGDDAAGHIAAIVGRDPMLAVNVLSWASRLDPSKTKPTTDLREAITSIGVREFYRKVEAVTPVSFNAGSIWDPGNFWLHSLATARISTMLSERLNLGTPRDAALAGLLHDIGQYILATQFPTHFGMLFSAGNSARSIGPDWERDLIGVHHGEIGAWTLERFGLPRVVQEVTLAHNALEDAGEPLAPSARMLLQIVQAADLLAGALVSADPPLTPFQSFTEEFAFAVERADLSPVRLVDEARQIVADLVTEFEFLFPQSASRSYYHRHPPLDEVCYFAPHPPYVDAVHTYLHVRSKSVKVLTNLKGQRVAAGTPIVVNLTHLPNTASRQEALALLVTTGWAKGRCGVVIVPEAIDKRYVMLLDDAWQLVNLPTHPSQWMRRLTDRTDKLKAVGIDNAA